MKNRRELRCGIVRLLCNAEQTSRAGDRDDRAIAALDHSRQHGTRDPVQGESVDLIGSANIRLGRIEQVLARDDSRVVDEDVDAAGSFGNAIDDRDLGDVHDVCVGRTARSNNLGADSFRRVTVAVPNDDVCTAASTLHAHLASQSASTTGDEDAGTREVSFRHRSLANHPIARVIRPPNCSFD